MSQEVLPDVSLAPATEGDLPVLLDLMRGLYAYSKFVFDGAVAERGLRQVLKEPSLGRVWLIANGPHTVGYVVLTLGFSLEFRGVDAFVDEIYIRPESRGRGIGTAAFELVAQAGRELGVHALHLEVERTNTDAQRLYRRVGFQDHDRYLMTRRLSPASERS